MDSIFNYIIFLIPLAIFIVRMVSQARNKGNTQAQPVIPVHFEDDEEDRPRKENVPYSLGRGSSEYFKGLNVPAGTNRSVFNHVPLEQSLKPDGPGNLDPSRSLKNADLTDIDLVSKNLISGFSRSPVAAPRTGGRDQGFLKIRNLTPMKQALVMAEILGPPKSLQ